MNQTNKTARKLFDKWNSKGPYETLSGAFTPASLDAAYAVQLALQNLHIPNRGKIVGRKIALSSKAMQQMTGMDQPVAAAFFASNVLPSPSTIKASDYVHLGLEFELAIELKADVIPQDQIFTRETAYDVIAAVRPAFELIEDGGADYATLDAHTLISDNAWCGGVVLGQKLDNWRDFDLGDIPSTVSQKGESDEQTNTGAADPLGSFSWVLNHFSERGITLSKGESIITGSAVRTRFPLAGDAFTYDVAGATVQLKVT